MRILKLSTGNAVLQQRHMPYIAVSAELIYTTQFHLPRTVATVLNQGLGYGFNLKILVFMKIMNSLWPPSKKMVHIALCMSAGWSVYPDSRFQDTCETYNKDRMTIPTSNLVSSRYWRSFFMFLFVLIQYSYYTIFWQVYSNIFATAQF